jgi:molybdenum cofactor cytidylyltransferase
VNLPGVILAAGRSSRMGRDKALLALGPTTLLGAAVDLFVSRLDPVVVVLGHHAGAIRVALPEDDPRLHVVVNEGYDRGMLSSLQTGLRAIPPESPGAVFTLVDHPAPRPETLDCLLAEFERTGAPLAIPVYRGERGHPVILARELIEELLALPPEASPKAPIRARYPRAAFVETDDPAVTADLDTPEAYREWTART